jgi:hypothetical protein
MQTNYSESAQSYFNLKKNAVLAPVALDCSIVEPSKINLDWSVVDGATAFDIYRDKHNQKIATVAGNVTHYEDTSITDYKTHTYWIETVAGSSHSVNRAEGFGRLDQGGPPKIDDLFISPSYGFVEGHEAIIYAYLEPSKTTVSYSWSFDADAVTETTPITAHDAHVHLDQPGNHTMTLTVTNAAGQDSKIFSFTTLALPQKPTAAFSTSDPIERNKVIYFDASTSTAENGHNVASYHWDTNADGISDFDTTNSQYALIFTKFGLNSISLQVEDERGLSSDWTSQSYLIEAPWLHGTNVGSNPGTQIGLLFGSSGLPFVAYEPDGTTLNVGRGDAFAGASWTPFSITSGGSVGSVSTAIVDGNPAVLYVDISGNAMKYARATSPDGSAWGAPVTAVTGDAGYSSLCVVNGRPAFTYSNGNLSGLRFVRANDTDGNSWGTPVTLDPAQYHGNYSSLSIINGFPAASYWDTAGLIYVRALDADGDTWGTPVTVDLGFGGAYWTGVDGSLAEINGRPAISYVGTHPTNGGELHFIRALDSNGNSWGSTTLLDVLGTGSFGSTSLRIVSGVPAIAYCNNGLHELRYIQATDADGVAWGAAKTLDSGGDYFAGYSSMAVYNGSPAIAYTDQGSGVVKYMYQAGN